jgi:superfamily II DNA/RNA helicase
MREVNVHDFSNTVTSTFQRYLFTRNLVADNEPELRQAFWNQLQALECFSRPPLLSTIPSYATSLSIDNLIGNVSPPQLHQALRKVDNAELDTRRPLYEHQVKSIELAQGHRNFVVATGTGSGKTECFLLPILDDALRNPGPGVRAILIYPMNALANDQLDRLRNLLQQIPEVTFGRYTGDTPWDLSGVSEEERSEIRRPNERYTREEIRSSPPNILLTNFAMMEYLLLRPGDNPIFQRRGLRFIVLDEAHTYSGAQGIEVSLLMRRITECYRKSSLQFILTSATLSDADEESRAKVAVFGNRLTGGEFSADDVLLGSVADPFENASGRETTLADYSKAVPSEEAFNEWLDALEDLTSFRDKLSSSGLTVPKQALEQDSVGKSLYELFRDSRELATLHKVCSSEPSTIAELSMRLWGRSGENAERITRWLTILGANASSGARALPLHPTRYHFFFRGLSGGSICLAPGCAERSKHPSSFWSNFVLEDRVECPACSSRVLALQTCVHCGLPAVGVRLDSSETWEPARYTDAERVLLLTWNMEDWEAEDGEDGDGGEGLPVQSAYLCLRCRRFSLDKEIEQCCDNPQRIKLQIIPHRGNGLLQKCPRCGGSARPFPSVLQQFSSGEDAPTAVLAESIVRALPIDDMRKPAAGRRILAFSDSRQRAAHFAPYLTRTTAETQFLKPLMEAIHRVGKTFAEQGAPLDEIANAFANSALKQPFVVLRKTGEEGDKDYEIKATQLLPPMAKQRLRRECLISLLQHFAASPRSRKTIPALGLASVEVAFSDFQRDEIKKQLPELFDNDTDGYALIQNLLYILLFRYAIVLPDGINLRDIQEGPQAATYHLSVQGNLSGRRRYRWNPYLAEKLRKSVVKKSHIAGLVAKFLNWDVESNQTELEALLTRIWDTLRELQVVEQVHPSEFQVNYERLVVHTNRNWYLCSRCGRLTVFPLGTRCASFDCQGSVQHQSALQMKDRLTNHHWYQRLVHTDPLPMVVKEHTAQLVNQTGREYQRNFREKDVNVLSSSTTFEMGVDVGQLKAVFLRNVPPTPANYIQRAGRAGRRREGAAFAVSFARSTPHDQFHFHSPLEIVQGRVLVPQINLANERLTQRHIDSYVLGQYLLKEVVKTGSERITVDDFFFDPSLQSSKAARFPAWIAKNKESLGGAVGRIIPKDCALASDAALQAAGEQMFGTSGVSQRLQDRLEAYEVQRKQLTGAIVEAARTGRSSEVTDANRALRSVEALIKQLKGEALIDFLAGEHWLPSYAFPQDVVRLLVRQEKYTDRMRLERDGEIGLSEYAPGAEIIADGKLFRSGGIDLQRKELEKRRYRVCGECRRVEFFTESEKVQAQCACGAFPGGLLGMPRTFIVPPGFTTLFEDSVEEPNLFRLKPPPNSEVFLLQGASEEMFCPHPEFPTITLGYSSKGTLFRANPGKKYAQFRICLKCGRSFEAKAKTNQHSAPWGSTCKSSYIVTTDLAFQFGTDTLQIRFSGDPVPPPINDEGFWLSLQTTLVAATAEVLAIPLSDIAGTYRSQFQAGAGGELVMYDRVPGGAGYVARIVDQLGTILGAALDRTLHCRNPLCDPEGSCYACLRSYGNQFKWALLKRGPVARWLEQLMARRTM